ncbi:UDP-2-acetamido-2-deoxy-ribo-hexuluronate aminotransferase [Candidatus Hakubella thermalkaliphila]|uniref:UDP-2-acetamido-2-deoxy-ribo-hexuluronate aminotransferase n=1 Tax=Candidatus Hakubella thermalkaliphila TaxID=2754717 RepID=A0A6V8PP83_9ACTN|nr:DegT/DnrJ/EryC1/StrS family aminotransferase [Candidatus Hakubella thermalkaliphila]GFP34449.1 UDP-2-acetamido-2-deoxy-ribo-hexuluronate aminotransferase [Candidatus Hakubella thermalkaliphila]
MITSRKMKVPFVDLARQYAALREEIDAALQSVLKGGQFILGENVRLFEEEFSSYCGARFAVGVGSGTEALHLALLACGIGSGDEVITVPNTAVATVAAISLVGACPVFVDVDPRTFTMDPDKIEEKISPRTRAILPVHLYGQAADLGPILSLADRYSLLVIEDACQAHGATYGSKRVGTFGQVGCFSFYPTKNLGAYGDSGMVLTDNLEIAERVRLLCNYGQSDRYHAVAEGLNSRLDELQAAVLRVKLRYLDRWNALRRQWADLYSSLLEGVEVPFLASGREHIFHLYVVKSKARNRLAAYLEEQGVPALVHYPIPVHLQVAYQHLGYREGDFPVSEACAQEVLSLPIFPEMREEEVAYVADLIRKFYQEEI